MLLLIASHLVPQEALAYKSKPKVPSKQTKKGCVLLNYRLTLQSAVVIPCCWVGMPCLNADGELVTFQDTCLGYEHQAHRFLQPGSSLNEDQQVLGSQLRRSCCHLEHPLRFSSKSRFECDFLPQVPVLAARAA